MVADFDDNSLYKAMKTHRGKMIEMEHRNILEDTSITAESWDQKTIY